MLAKHKVGSSTLLTRSIFKPLRNRGLFSCGRTRLKLSKLGFPFFGFIHMKLSATARRLAALYSTRIEKSDVGASERQAEWKLGI
jgi:hypothetical protein